MRSTGAIVLMMPVFLCACGGDQKDTFTASGIIEGTPIKVAAQTGGYILKVNFDEGELVEQDRVIAVIDTEKLVYQLDQVGAGLEEINVQRQINLNTVAKARSDFENIKKKYERFKDLYEKNSASKQTLDDLATAFDAAKAQLENAQQSLKMIESKRKGLQAQRNLLRRQISDATIVSPVSGTVTTKFYETGETIPTGFGIMEIIDLSEMWTKVYVSETLLPKVKVGQQATIRIDGTDRELTGFVSWISPKAEFTPKSILTEETRTSLVYAVKVLVDNPDQVLKHGMPVEVALEL